MTFDSAFPECDGQNNSSILLPRPSERGFVQESLQFPRGEGTKRSSLKRGTDEFGHTFEHLVIQEIIAYLGYSGSNEKLTYWRTYTGLEVDAVLGDAKVAVEIKSVEEIKTKHRKGLKAFGEEHPECRQII